MEHTHIVNHFAFQYLPNLSTGVKIIFAGKKNLEIFLHDRENIIASETAQFVTWWFFNCHPLLNSFSGMDTIKFTIDRSE